MPNQQLQPDQKGVNAPKPKASAKDEAERVNRMQARYRKAENAVLPKHQQFKILDTFDRGEQWKDQSLPPWIPKPVANWMRYVRTIKRANLASAIPSANYTARTPEQAPLVDKLHKAYKHVWEVEKVPRIIRRCIDRSLIQGTAIATVYNDESAYGGQYFGPNDPKNALYQGKICVKRFPLTRFFPDPDAYCLDDCKYIETTDNLPLRTVKANKKYQEYAGKKLAEITTQQLAQSETEAGDAFDRDQTISGGQTFQTHNDEMVTVHTHWERYINDQGRWQMDVTQYLSGANFELYRVEDAKPSVYPFAVLYDEEEENDFWGGSTLKDILEQQKIINKTAQVSSILGTLHQNPQKVVTKTSGINAKELARTGQMPGKVWTTNDQDPTKSIHYSQPPDIPKGLFETEDRTKADIREMVGINEAYTGQSVGSLTTSTGVNSLIERATLRDRDKMVQIDEFVERISDLIVMNIMYKWQDERPITTTGPNGKPQYENYTPIDEAMIDNLEWTVRSDVYAKAPTTAALRKQQADNLMQMQGQFQFDPPVIIPEEWIRFQDFDFKEEILLRMQTDRERKEQMAGQDYAQMIIQAADQIAQARSKGMAPENAQNMALQMAQQMLQQKQASDSKNGISSQVPEQAPQQGVTGQQAMMAQARGM
jgi:hypothetical protein